MLSPFSYNSIEGEEKEEEGEEEEEEGKEEEGGEEEEEGEEEEGEEDMRKNNNSSNRNNIKGLVSSPPWPMYFVTGGTCQFFVLRHRVPGVCVWGGYSFISER